MRFTRMAMLVPSEAIPRGSASAESHSATRWRWLPSTQAYTIRKSYRLHLPRIAATTFG